MSLEGLPLFPNFRLLTLADKKTITDYYNNFEPDADYKFASLWSYNVENDAAFSQLNGNLVIKFRDYITTEAFYSFLGNTDVISTGAKLLALAEEENVLKELKLISESCNIDDLKNNFTVIEDRGNFDYILSVQETMQLVGKKYHTHKNHVNRFHTLYPKAITRLLNPSDPIIQSEIEQLFFRWEKGRGKNRTETQHELSAIQRLVKDAHAFSLLIIGIYVDEKLIGFSINDLDHPSVAQNHFAKSDPDYKEVYYILMNALATALDAKGYQYINIECDLDIPGLRFAKEQWNPVRFFRKYTIASR